MNQRKKIEEILSYISQHSTENIDTAMLEKMQGVLLLNRKKTTYIDSEVNFYTY
jgi:hypothetical protein